MTLNWPAKGLVVADQPGGAGPISRPTARLLVVVDLHDPVHRLLLAEFIANDRPILASYKGEILYPVLVNDYPEEIRRLPGAHRLSRPVHPGGDRGKWLDDLAADPLFLHHRELLPAHSAPTAPFWLLARKMPARPIHSRTRTQCTLGNMNWLGTDDQARDVTARLIYGFRISVLFGLTLTVFSALIGVAAGAVQGYFGGWTDLLMQRFIEIWSSMPVLYILLIIAAVLPPGFWILLGIMLLFSWVSFVGMVRAEFLRARNFEYVNAARALGVGNRKIMFRTCCPTPWWRR
jgi:microcin C transport system permease protein